MNPARPIPVVAGRSGTHNAATMAITAQIQGLELPNPELPVFHFCAGGFCTGGHSHGSKTTVSHFVNKEAPGLAGAGFIDPVVAAVCIAGVWLHSMFETLRRTTKRE